MGSISVLGPALLLIGSVNNPVLFHFLKATTQKKGNKVLLKYRIQSNLHKGGTSWSLQNSIKLTNTWQNRARFGADVPKLRKK